MKFSKEMLLDKMGEHLESQVTGNSRWSIHHTAIFEHEGKFYETTYAVGATESQDETPYQYDDDEIECTEVHKVEKTIKTWEYV